MTSMNTHFTGLVTGLAVAAVLMIGPSLPGYAEDAARPDAPQAPAPTEAPPASVPRPSLVPKTEQPAPPPAAAETAPSPHGRYAHRHHRRYGYYRTAYWEPFPLYLPHFDRNRMHWTRVRWFSF
jgi:hypothetical protein